MRDEEVLEKLKEVVASFGLSLDDPEIKEFFYGTRKIYQDGSYDEETQKAYFASVGIKPIVMTLLPSDFENSGYGVSNQTCLMDWFLYRNSSHNPLVWKNIGKDSASIKQSFEETRKESGPIMLTNDGYYFNGNDGNHRLLTLIINHFLERKAAKTEEEKLAVDKRYEMDLEVCVPCCAELYSLLDKEVQSYAYHYWEKDEERVFPNSVCKYREKMFENPKENTYFVTFIPEKNCYKYNLNGVRFEGNEQELVQFLQTKEETNLPIMFWECNGTYYISCYNMVWKSKDEAKLLELKPRIIKALENKTLTYHTFLEVKDIDKNTYQVRLDEINVRGEEKIKQFAAIMEEFLKDKQTDILFDDAKKRQEREEFLIYCKQCQHFSFDCLIFTEKEYTNLTKEQYVKIYQQMVALEQCLKKLNVTVGC